MTKKLVMSELLNMPSNIFFNAKLMISLVL